MNVRLLSSLTGFAIVGSVLIAPPSMATPDCDVQDVQCWKDYYGVTTPDYGYNTPTPEDNSLVTEPVAQEDNETITEDNETVTALLDEGIGEETVIVKEKDGDIIVGEVTPDEKQELLSHPDVAVVEEDSVVRINEVGSW